LSVATGLPHEYFGRQDDEIVATYLDILKQAHGGKGRGPRDEAPEGASSARQMSG
jgi:hypothetical protein